MSWQDANEVIGSTMGNAEGKNNSMGVVLKVDFNLTSSPISGERSRGLVLAGTVAVRPRPSSPDHDHAQRPAHGWGTIRPRCVRWPTMSYFPALVFATRVLPRILSSATHPNQLAPTVAVRCHVARHVTQPWLMLT